MEHRKAIILMLVSLIIRLTCLKELKGQSFSGDVRIMFNNVENAFDIFNDPLTNDDDFLPGGLMRWNQTRYNKKINSLYKSIIAAGEWNPPEIVALSEVESRKVLEDLIYGTYLSKYNYGIVHEDSPDRRGIDVCLIYRKDAVRVSGYDYLVPSGLSFTSRSILYARLVNDIDTFHIFVNHWPSRKGGVMATIDMRLKIAEMLRLKIDSLQKATGGKAKIIVTGDFNSTPDDQEIKILISAKEGYPGMLNLSAVKKEGHEGTYKYMGSWEMIDQMIVSEYLQDNKRGFFSDNNSFRILNPDFLLIKDPNYPGMMPFSTYRGYRYQGGFSDHLPIMITLHRKLPD